MKIKTSETTPSQINYLVAKCEGIEVVAMKEGRATFSDPTDDGALNEMPINYSTDWAQGGPIIEREKISIQELEGIWSAFFRDKLFEDDNSECWQDGSTPLIAAMRCYIASKLGEECDIPDELITGE